jgi:hypothetical protein
MKIPDLRDGQYPRWEMEMVARYPLALFEMRRPSVPLNKPETEPLARWGLEIHAGWRTLVERMLARLEAAIAAQPVGDRDGFRIVQLKEKFGRLTVYLDREATPVMRAAISDAGEESAAVSLRNLEDGGAAC